jgi:hypothetical protein
MYFGASQGTSTVTFNGTPAIPTSWSDTTIKTAVPAGAATGNVVVTVGGLTSNGVVYTVNSPVPIPAPPVDLPPVPGGNGLITVTSLSSSSLNLTWAAATDNKPGLSYQVEKDGTVIKPYTAGLLAFRVSGLKIAQTPTFIVTVKDSAGNTATYKTAIVPTTYGWH